ncbi:MAG: hypothetical protein AVDCRST_MAG85-3823, partial [uncultured Solirubrobacteraceae bacterium]
ARSPLRRPRLPSMRDRREGARDQGRRLQP